MMAGKDKSLLGEEYWMRCPFCGDSEKHPNKAHFSINVKQHKYYCYRCGEGGILPQEVVHELISFSDVILSPTKKTTQHKFQRIHSYVHQLGVGPRSTRYSALDRYHLGEFDAFLSRAADGSIWGYHFRKIGPQKMSSTLGVRALGYSGENIRRRWARVVEGPYDVIDPAHDICVFGTALSAFQAWMLRGISLVFCPDGDVWQDPKKLRAYFSRIFYFQSRGYLILQGLEVCPDGKDPDECYPSERRSLTQSEIAAFRRIWLKERAPRSKRPLTSLFSSQLFKQAERNGKHVRE